ncbi:peptidase M14 family protein [Candidatus Bathyarchaeota archaeon]|nr:peptidase M14 family protein [Candidatus Bathyarchaeota archaeon]
MVGKIKSPEEFFGVKPGTDKILIRWDKIVDYFWDLNENSDRIKVEEVGKTTEGNSMLLVFISSSQNIQKLDKIKQESWSISHPKTLKQKDVDKIIEKGKAVVGMTMSIHASEVGGTQVSPELAYELITKEDDLTKKIRDEVVLLLYPCANPDGQIMTVDWYNKYLGTEYEGSSLPYLYHKYVGHDNNRDALTLTQIETKIMNKTFLKEWFPQAFLDTHQMGSTGARFYVPPNSNPLNEVVDPLVWTEQRHYGSQMLIRMESSGITGVESASSYPADFMPGFSLVFPWFGICGMFTETASVKGATPVYVHYHQLTGSQRGRPEYRAQTNFIHPWKGGWWHLKNIIDGQKTACLATLEVAANNRELILSNMYKKAVSAMGKGSTELPFAFVIPPGQWDNVTTHKLLRTLRELSVEIHIAEKQFKIGDAIYPSGSYVIFTSQTARSFIISLLDRTFYRDCVWVRNQDGIPMMNYDFATQTMAEFKGVNVIKVDVPITGKFKLLNEVSLPVGEVEPSKNGWLIDGRLNNSFKTVNILLSKGVKVHRIDEPIKIADEMVPAGSWYIPNGKNVEKALKEAASASNVNTYSLTSALEFKSHEAKKLRIGIYQRYMGGNMDEGWNRWLLEQYNFEYTSVHDADVKAGLKDKYDVLIFPSDSTAMITGEKLEEYYEKRSRGTSVMPVYPPEYITGIKNEGVGKVKEFVEAGGTVLCLNEAIDFGMDQLKVPTSNPVKELKSDKFHCPGSTLWVNIDNKNPLAYGMPDKGLILVRGNLALAVKSGTDGDKIKALLTYPEERLMQSGWLIGEEHLARKAAMVEAKIKQGRVILYAFAPQSRALTDATFKLFFNALVG